MMKVPITKPYFDDCEKEYVLKPLKTGWLTQGQFVSEFERLFADFTGSKFAIATTSCTTALHLGLVVLGIGKGDKVILPSFTYVASANAVEYTGAEVIFCDIDLRTFNIDVEKLEEIIKRKMMRDGKKKRVKCIMPVNLFGLCAELPKIVKIARQYNLKVIEDSACGVGAYIGNKHSGTFGDLGCFSFHPRKVITTGEGGMIITNNKKIAEKLKMLRNHGASRSDLERHVKKGGSLLPEFNILGYNYRMTDIQGAIGVCQMKKLNHILRKRREIAEIYTEELKGSYLLPPYVPDGYTHSFQSYVCLFSGGEDIFHISNTKVKKLNKIRNRFMYELEKRGISTRQGTHAVHTLGYYRKKYGLREKEFPNSWIADRLSVALPLYPQMSQSDIEYVLENIKDVLKRI